MEIDGNRIVTLQAKITNLNENGFVDISQPRSDHTLDYPLVEVPAPIMLAITGMGVKHVFLLAVLALLFGMGLIATGLRLRRLTAE